MLDALPVIGKRLRRAPRKHIETTYFDTSDRRFTDNGFALRVRKQDKNALQLLAGGPIEDALLPDALRPPRWREAVVLLGGLGFAALVARVTVGLLLSL